MKYLLLGFMFVLSGCMKGRPVSGENGMRRFVDSENNVICYTLYDSSGMSCVKVAP